VSSVIGEWLVIPTQLAMAFGFAIPCFKLVNAMANSSLLPSSLGLQNKNNYAAIVFSMSLSFLTCLLPYYFPTVNLSNVATIFACITYLSGLYAYYKMKTDFSTRDHKFANPFGIPGAIFAACMFILTIISLLGFQEDYSTAYAVSMYVGFLTIYYFAYAKKFQQFSDDEQKTLLVLHVMENNKRKKRIKPMRKLWVNPKKTNRQVVSVSSDNYLDSSCGNRNSSAYGTGLHHNNVELPSRYNQSIGEGGNRSVHSGHSISVKSRSQPMSLAAPIAPASRPITALILPLTSYYNQITNAYNGVPSQERQLSQGTIERAERAYHGNEEHTENDSAAVVFPSSNSPPPIMVINHEAPEEKEVLQSLESNEILP